MRGGDRHGCHPSFIVTLLFTPSVEGNGLFSANCVSMVLLLIAKGIDKCRIEDSLRGRMTEMKHVG